MGNPYVGEIRMFAGEFAPVGWAFCDGSLQSISEYFALFNLIGTTYGGDGLQTFALPNLQSRVPVHAGSDIQGDVYVIGQSGGAEAVTLTAAQVGAHSHPLNAVSSGGSVASPAGALPGVSTPSLPGTSFQYGTLSGNLTSLTPATIGPSAGGQPHSNIQPYQAITFIISLLGIFPSPN